MPLVPVVKAACPDGRIKATAKALAATISAHIIDTILTFIDCNHDFHHKT
jgi:hypothetical protein